MLKGNSDNCDGNDFEMWLPAHKVNVFYGDRMVSSEKSFLCSQVVGGGIVKTLMSS